ncbi:MAG: phosphomannomutase/phosphoglucomutase [Alphaproteobacteria bacterium]|nr:phosphomannomutase/phosphoglucomutase [Alphaproteobacteria bacterium]MCB9930562.1 phosphomannomutase/phosphoglucomutase [Alphaproteobacteria bacterium]
MQHAFNPTILREYDIRGVVGDTLHTTDARAIGQAFATVARARGATRIAVGYDGRLSSPAMADAVVEGLAAGGVDVVRVGLGPTPMLYFAGYHLAVDGGIQITGSHNPPDYNGFKMTLLKKPFYGEDIQEIGRIAAAGAFATGAGAVSSADIQQAYVDRMLEDFTPGRPLTVVWDCGNGAAGPSVEALVARLPGRHTVLNAPVDGTFPAHHPDPTLPETLEQLQAAVKQAGAELGIAFDGDGDRIGVIDGEGEVLWADQLLVLLARDVLSRHPGATVIADVKASQVLFDAVAAAGGQPLMYRTGHSLIKAKMAEVGAPLAGEMSGHIFYADRYYGYDDALYVAVRTLGVLAGGGQTLADFRRTLPAVVNTPELRFTCAEDRKFVVPAEVHERLKAEGADVDATDGVRVNTADGWWLLRASNTQDVLVARCEAADQSGLDRLKQALAGQLQASGVALPPGF